MPERFEIYIVYKRRYINTLRFLTFPDFSTLDQQLLNSPYGIQDEESSRNMFIGNK